MLAPEQQPPEFILDEPSERWPSPKTHNRHEEQGRVWTASNFQTQTSPGAQPVPKIVEEIPPVTSNSTGLTSHCRQIVSESKVPGQFGCEWMGGRSPVRPTTAVPAHGR